MTRPTVAQAQAWRPDALHTLADAWDAAARRLGELVDDAAADAHRSRDYWTGAAADAARERADRIAAETAAVARVLVIAGGGSPRRRRPDGGGPRGRRGVGREGSR